MKVVIATTHVTIMKIKNVQDPYCMRMMTYLVYISKLKTPEPLVCAMACVCAPYPTHILLSLIISIT